MSKVNEKQIEEIAASLREMEYGTINIKVHEGKITQIDTTTKKRFSLTERDSRKMK
jgi:hypothetical protein